MATQIALLVTRLVADTRQFEASMAGANTTMGKFRKGVGVAGLAAAVGLGLAVDQSVELGKKNTMLQTILGASDDQMQELKNTALQYSGAQNTATTSASEAYDVYLALAKAGLSRNQILKATPDILNLATASETSHANAADAVVRAMTGYNLQAKDSKRITDLMTGSIQGSTLSWDDLDASLRQLGPVPHMVGMNFKEVNAIMAENADHNLRNSDSGTGLRTSLLRMLNPTKQISDVMKQYNLRLYDQHGRMKNIRDIIGQLHDKLGPLTQKERNHALAVLGGSDAVRQMGIWTKGGTAEFDKYMGRVDKTGIAQKIATKNAQSNAAAFDRFKTSMSNLGVVLGDAILPALADAADLLTRLVTWLENSETASAILSFSVQDLGKMIWRVFTKTIPNGVRQGISWVKDRLADALHSATSTVRGWGSDVISFFRSWAGRLFDFLSSLPNRFLEWGKKLGSKLKDGLISGIKGVADTIAKNFAGAINAVIRAWNDLTIPGISIGIHKGPIDYDVSVGPWDLPNMNPVSLARGGIVTGPQLAVIGDNASRREAVIPLSDRGGLGGGDVHIHVNVEGSVLSEQNLQDVVLNALTTYGRRNGRVKLASTSRS